MLTFGSLFSGIGGLDLGLERAGLMCAWQVEIEQKCRDVLDRHWPNVPKYEDVRNVGKQNLEPVDVICGGFPCQDISNAGKQAGIEGARSGLWTEMHRIICELRPRYVVVENVAALLYRGMGAVLRDLATSGYDAEWQVFPAGAFGAPHIRERVYIVAYPNGEHGDSRLVFHGEHSKAIFTESNRNRAKIWSTAPAAFDGMVNGVSYWVDRMRMMGNAAVPQIAEWIGRQLLAALENE